MPHVSSPAIVLRVTEHGDYDKIITCLTHKRGKISLIAKGAKKSVKRFSGVLELFSVLNLVWSSGRGRGLPVLLEASVVNPFEQIRTDITRTAYASYWCELVDRWTEQGQEQVPVYRLLEYVLDQLDSAKISVHPLHIGFQLRFMALSGFRPGLDNCHSCRKPLEQFVGSSVVFDVKRGGVLCEECTPQKRDPPPLAMGTVKMLSWVLNAPLGKLNRIKFSAQAIEESVRVLEAFVLYHLGKETRSLKFLKHIESTLPQ